MVRLGLFGNIANNFFRLGQILNSQENLKVTLFLPESGDATNFPEGDQPSAKTDQWEWIDRGEQNQLRRAFRFGKGNLLSKLNSQDVVFISSINVVIAPLIRKPKVVFCPTGADMNVFPFFRTHLKFYRDVHGARQTYAPKNLIRMYLVSLGTRIGIKSCDYILGNPFSPYKLSERSLKISALKILEFPPPLAIDTEVFHSRPLSEISLPNEILDQFKEFEFRIFSPSRILINRDAAYVRIGQYKQNDVLVRGFAQFLESNPKRRSGLFLIDRGRMMASDTENLKNLVKELGISQNVVWLRPLHGNSFDRSALIDMYSICDVIADDFGVGWFGSASLEVLSCGKPLLNYVDAATMSEMYPWHPFLSSNTAQGIGMLIKELYEDPAKVSEIGKESRRWVNEFHSAEPIRKRYSGIIERIAGS